MYIPHHKKKYIIGIYLICWLFACASQETQYYRSASTPPTSSPSVVSTEFAPSHASLQSEAQVEGLQLWTRQPTIPWVLSMYE